MNKNRYSESFTGGEETLFSISFQRRNGEKEELILLPTNRREMQNQMRRRKEVFLTFKGGEKRGLLHL